MATILVVDNQEAMRAHLRDALEGDGHEVLEAANGRLGLALYRARAADLIITDMVMPEMNGLDMLLEMTRRCPNVNAIAISGGRGNHGWLDAAKLLGTRQTFQKPLDMEKLLDAVRDDLAH
jgi:two-component system response regulator (stage 0 sporulation protein F)